ncbi:hypothetical protein [Pleomorphomonas sp. T1.2MG-36]|uniref:hypothetical protein n=1 Tax=Pleomorphomonas sp. T1.2MG-36 TaxID=3041167 RepID=UPI0025417FF0|nr:hypothetical protein [Pleomorphomonas sp. T1.2MG-36]
MQANKGPHYGVVWWELEIDGVVSGLNRSKITSEMPLTDAPDELYAAALLDALSFVPPNSDVRLFNDYEAFHGAFSKDFLIKWERENFKGRPIWREVSRCLNENHITVGRSKAEKGSPDLKRLKALQAPQIGFNGFNGKDAA